VGRGEARDRECERDEAAEPGVEAMTAVTGRAESDRERVTDDFDARLRFVAGAETDSSSSPSSPSSSTFTDDDSSVAAALPAFFLLRVDFTVAAAAFFCWTATAAACTSGSTACAA